MARANTDEKKRAKVLEGALIILFREGVSSLTMDRIASRQGISKKTLYQLFENKEQLIVEAVERRLAEVAARVNAAFQDRTCSFPVRLGNMMGVVVRQLAEIGERLIRDVFYREPQLWERVDRFRREQIFGMIAELFEEGVRDGYVRPDIDSQLVPTLFVTTLSAVMSPAQFFTLRTPPALLFENLLRILLGGILTEEARAQFFAREVGK
jgi:AcrR family transcriptional regulator